MKSVDLIQFLMCLTIIGLWVTIAVIQFKLRKRLNPKFDPVFKKDLWWVAFAVDTFESLSRAGVYSSWVACPKIFARMKLEPADFNFRQQIDLATYRLCVLHTWLTFSTFLVITPVGILVMRHIERLK